MKPESRFRQAVHRHLPNDVFHESASAIYTNGTPDDYYERPGGFCRIEYKHYVKAPVRAEIDLIKESGKDRKRKLSLLQEDWLQRAYDNGMPTYVIVGFESGHDMWGVVFYSPDEWLRPWSRAELEERRMRPKELAAEISQHLIGGVRSDSRKHGERK